MNKNQFLNELVASYGVLYVKLHQFHWYVKGKHFYQVHALFEDLYDEVTENFDEVAERMLQIDLKPASTLKEYVELSFIKETVYNGLSERDMLNATIADFEVLQSKYAEGITLFEGDDVTVDILTGLKAKIDKHLWTLKAVVA